MDKEFEEKRAFIEQAINEDLRPAWGLSEIQAAALYDLGYRKVAETKSEE